MPAETRRFDARLAETRWRGRVQQVSAHAAVARADAQPARRLVLLDAARPLVPWSLAWSRPLSVGDAIELENKLICVRPAAGAPLRANLRGRGVDLAVDAQPSTRAPLRLSLPPLPDATARLLGAADALARGIEAATERRVAQALQPLVALARSGERSPGFWQQAVDGLAGLGPGSTPTGDDVLTGFACALRVLTARGAVATGCVEALGAALVAVPAQATTETSREMLAEAAAGVFPEPLAKLARRLRPGAGSPALPSTLMEEFSMLGARSGCDMLAGALALLQAFATVPAATGGSRA